MTPRHSGAALAVIAVLLAGCTAQPPSARRDPLGGTATAAGLRLAAFSSCADALARLKAAARDSVGPYGFSGQPWLTADLSDGDARAAAGDKAAPADAGAARQPASAAEPAYSSTNTHEAGVDEPDLVKTDGKRIVTVSNGVLRVVDPARRALVGSLRLGTGDSVRAIRWPGADLLLHGDRALVLIRSTGPVMRAEPDDAKPLPFAGSRLLLVDLAGAPRLLAEHHFDGVLLDARQVGSVARVVVRSAPRLLFPQRATGAEADRIAANRRIIDRATADDWLPRYELTENGRTTAGQVPCGQVSHPDAYSGAAMLTVLTFDLNRPALGDGAPVTVAADGDTVYGTGSSLYVATDQRWQPAFRSMRRPTAAARTQIFKFDTSGTGRPRYVAGGTVPGWLVNQYAMSEWDGHLRVASTLDGDSGDPTRSVSTVYVLRQRGGRLAEQGRIGGLGKGERIYSVRFVGPVGYVVTFRQTDPLYTVDLGDPARPRIAGELKITGYSAYLHPAGDGRLIGVGQEASAQGRTQGTQVSLFDVSDLEHPVRLARHHVVNGHSAAEFDPHAFLYWPADRLLVLPLTLQPTRQDGTRASPTSALLLRVDATTLTERGTLRHDPRGESTLIDAPIMRSLVVNGVLWTLSHNGLQATDMSTLERLRWIAL